MTPSDKYPLALDCLQEEIVLVNEKIINQAIHASRESPRKRIILPFHKSPSDNLQRMLNALQPMSYIQPHRHLDPPKAESVIVLKGGIVYIEFTNTGEIKNFYELSSGSFNIGIDTEPGIYHTFLATAEDTVLFEVKPGPYEPASDKDFASWAPSEGSEKAEEYMLSLYEIADMARHASPADRKAAGPIKPL